MKKFLKNVTKKVAGATVKKAVMAAVLTTGLLVGAAQNSAQARIFPYDHTSGDGCTTFHFGWFGRYIGAIDNCY